ncbi:transcriptional regulator, PadR-like family [Fibrisoma limi BUZ 3]|uniref:Transcriptional regulator, PadR-like family n=1 Tax=Fibrisoma limi BUZ 3 TaxID=1185876 RepID=I2GT31_9BACT|nr:helix-turn-helix transcriptional regulator [Fibrisoma limi]CCH57060.1 transcriptional regulator, PadR-like family [Fibrisoma limi BUZ 3]
MKGTHLGEFEEIVLEELSERLERPISPGVVHQTMQRLAEKGLVHSRFSEPIAEPGGRSKRLFTVTVAGEQALREAQRIRNELWDGIPKTAFSHPL